VETALATTVTSVSGEKTAGIPAELFDEIVRQHQRRVYRVIYLLVRDADAADTLTQECFLRAYKSRDGFRGECRIDTWLLRIAVNLVRDHGKNRRTAFWKKLIGWDHSEPGSEVAEALVSPQPSPERVLLAREHLESVWSAMGSLSEQQRTIFLLRFGEEMPLSEIADTLGITVGAVKAHLCRATGKVRKVVEEKSCK